MSVSMISYTDKFKKKDINMMDMFKNKKVLMNILKGSVIFFTACWNYYAP